MKNLVFDQIGFMLAFEEVNPRKIAASGFLVGGIAMVLRRMGQFVRQ